MPANACSFEVWLHQSDAIIQKQGINLPSTAIRDCLLMPLWKTGHTGLDAGCAVFIKRVTRFAADGILAKSGVMGW